ncbi:MAG: hypothetical protein KF725_13995 [Cyclobacteriaceae bacterium]|nr:hypothetical protein [Cyclobacteriaceae bacterium]
MKINRYKTLAVLTLFGVLLACEPNEDLFPLPYDNRETGSYLRVIKISSFVWDLDALDRSGFEAVYESVDRNFGADLTRVEWYATYRSAGGLITDEVLVKTLNASEMGFANVPEPTGSKYLRSAPIKITAQETLTALNTLTTDPDGNTCSGIFPDICPALPFPGTLGLGDRVVFRVKIYDNKGRAFTVNNPQVAAAPKLGNANEANITPNLTGGIFYSSPMLYTMFVQRMTDTGNDDAYTGTYRMAQVARWAPDFATNANNLQILKNFPQPWMRPFVFATSSTDSTQTVTLQKVPNGLSTMRQFTCRYRGQDITVVINFERQSFGQTGGGLTGAAGTAALATMNAISNPAPPTIPGLGFPAGTTNNNIGSIMVPLINTTTNCTPDRQFYIMTAAQFNPTLPGAPGTFSGDLEMPKGVPKRVFPNRGYYRFDRDGLTPGDVFSISVDDDVDEYGRRNGYCNWYTRVYLTLTKL